MTGVSLGSPLGAIVAAVVGGLLGRLLTQTVLRWLAVYEHDADEQTTLPPEARLAGRFTPGQTASRWIECAAVVASVALWWWELHQLGQLPASVVGGPTAVVSATLVLRYAAHLAFGWLLAAATWIDIRHRIIPDCITVPGVLAGCVCVWLAPDVLLPIATEVPRSFASPQVQSDVLGCVGGLRSASGWEWLGPSPQVSSLLLAIGIFCVWWSICTSPAYGIEKRRWLEPRNLILGAGFVAILVAWSLGTDRFRGLQSSLVGVAVSGGIVWATRAGASRAMGREAMGLGDVTLMAMVGAWLGWQACVLAFFLAAFIGLAHGLVQLARHREHELPYGPSLCLATVCVVVFWRPLWTSAAISFEEPLQLAVVVAGVVLLTAVTLYFWRMIRGCSAG